MKKLLLVKEVAEILNCSSRTVYRLASAGELKACRVCSLSESFLTPWIHMSSAASPNSSLRMAFTCTQKTVTDASAVTGVTGLPDFPPTFFLYPPNNRSVHKMHNTTA
ncbi:helix-turn-helix domain-containing protein [uncultured Desulfosarcina sp.]|uniref:helix-turn-helix domain-containing protein n=1 Tax=uncultured Desulfosarcina sp. TaxID=218289 RepID=UPI0029C641A9|nr:helix-turn-helix domain-containing protein [uncultured Desulfosarcina sp.]